MLEELLLFGDAAACGARIDRYREAGVTTPVLMPLSVAGSLEERTERVTALVEALAPATRERPAPLSRAGPAPTPLVPGDT
jgi:hypothetical protein